MNLISNRHRDPKAFQPSDAHRDLAEAHARSGNIDRFLCVFEFTGTES